MSRTKPKEQRRGGARDESDVHIGYTREQLAELLESVRRKCEAIRRREDVRIQRGGR